MSAKAREGMGTEARCRECTESEAEAMWALLEADLAPPPVTRRAPNPLRAASPERLAAYRERVAEIARCRRA